MTLRGVFIGGRGLRAGWRVALWLLLHILVLIPVGLLAWGLLRPGAPFSELVVQALAAVADLGLLLLLARWLDHTAPAGVGLPGPPLRVLRDLSLGLLLGVALLLLSVLPAVLIGGVSLGKGSATPASAALMALALLFAAAEEELLCRGYAFQWTAAGLSPGWATGIFSILFACVHLMNPGMTPLAWGSIALAGVLLAIARLKSGGLWLPIGLHFGWNLTEGMLLGVPVSGIPFPSLARASFQGPTWATGGAFGPEASLGSVAAVLVGTALLFLSRRRPSGTPAAP